MGSSGKPSNLTWVKVYDLDAGSLSDFSLHESGLWTLTGNPKVLAQSGNDGGPISLPYASIAAAVTALFGVLAIGAKLEVRISDALAADQEVTAQSLGASIQFKGDGTVNNNGVSGPVEVGHWYALSVSRSLLTIAGDGTIGLANPAWTQFVAEFIRGDEPLQLRKLQVFVLSLSSPGS